MTPKEKAIELYEKFIFPCWECDEFTKAKESALLAVNEILSNDNLYTELFIYYSEVKREIEKL
jgi:hypothetical protein